MVVFCSAHNCQISFSSLVSLDLQLLYLGVLQSVERFS